MNNQNIERSVADAILQKETSVTIGGHTFKVAQPTPATLIMASALIAELPTFDVNSNHIIVDILAKAKDAEVIGKIVATFILGAKRIKEKRTIKTGLFRKQNEIEWLSDYILDNLQCSEISQIINQRLLDMQIYDFFALTTSLSIASITKPTKEVETASGVL
ncbi:MAG: hypothetical protein MJZ41_07545 [Bacteroidaceae bacterium]|nr:hypothetical protein [Bacteroidaceae bacterium]